MADVGAIVQRNLSRVQSRIADACGRAGRQRSDVTLVGITKYVGAEVAAACLRCGLKSLGESRPQELWKKAVAVPDAEWHLVGHLQRNKIDRTLPLARLIHSVDSTRLLDALETQAKKTGRQVEVLLEFNLSGEEAKHGFRAEELPSIIPSAQRLEAVRVHGLMTMAALSEDPEAARPTFAALRDLRENLRRQLPPGHEMRHLSMGMTNDFEIAVEEGATLVRIGSALFEGIEAAET